MQKFYKKVSETPLEALNRFKIENPELKDEILSYIGRLDPMAEGDFLILIGKEENQQREKYLNSDKEYVAEIVFGFKTDTNDVLGLLPATLLSETSKDELKVNKELDFIEVENHIQNFTKITKQKYPWFSSKRFKGRALFDWFKKNQTDLVERPEKEIKVYDLKDIEFSEISKIDFHNDLKERIKNVNGEFRQDEILNKWEQVLDADNRASLHTCKFTISVSSGTYIRGLIETLSEELNYPVVLYKLKRTKILGQVF